VSGPGLIHALGGMANANMNCWYVRTLQTEGPSTHVQWSFLSKEGMLSFHCKK
jgi:hypothetical protein